MESKDYLAYVVEQIHSTIVTTVDGEGMPVTAAIDMMDYDDNSLYFITARGKVFYHRLISHPFVAFTAMKGKDTMSTVAISIRGKVRELGSELLPKIFEKNSYMAEIYPNEKSRGGLTVFQIYEGTGEWFDLSVKPIERADFSFGGAEKLQQGYFVNDKCTGCYLCFSKCPQQCIDISVTPVIISQNNCLHCGNCYEICPVQAIEKRG